MSISIVTCRTTSGEISGFPAHSREAQHRPQEVSLRLKASAAALVVGRRVGHVCTVTPPRP